MKILGTVVCSVCGCETFRLVVPDGAGKTVLSFAECTKCGEWSNNYTSKDVRRIKPKKETST